MYYQIKRTLKNTLFAEEMDLAFRKASYDSALSRKKLLEQNLKELEEKPLDLAVDRLPEELKSDAKAIYDEDRKIEKERRDAITAVRTELKTATQRLQEEDGALAEMYSTIFQHREKWDFLKHYQITKTYADK